MYHHSVKHLTNQMNANMNDKQRIELLEAKVAMLESQLAQVKSTSVSNLTDAERELRDYIAKKELERLKQEEMTKFYADLRREESKTFDEDSYYSHAWGGR